MVPDKLLCSMASAPEQEAKGALGALGVQPCLGCPSPARVFPSLRENSISKEGGPAIARALRSNSTLRKLE